MTSDEIPSRAVALWLKIVMGLVIAIIVVGGTTRLTNSGLSITEWAPIRGALPPLSNADWLREFEKYKQIPEFLAEHPDMNLAGFKFIYFWEWSHRQLGRIIGLVYILPLLYFAVRRRFPRGKGGFYLIPGVLIGLQGAIGWWMVHSGLQSGMVDVSQYRLATHLGLAFVILGVLSWLLQTHKVRFTKSGVSALPKSSWSLLGLIYLQIIAGAFVAGTKAGRSYNEWPLMDGDFVPAGYFVQSPIWRNLFENIAAIQFNHRILAYIILILTVWMWNATRKLPTLNKSVTILLALIAWQVTLGVITLLTGDNVGKTHLSLALLHQFSAILVFLAALSATWKCQNIIR